MVLCMMEDEANTGAEQPVDESLEQAAQHNVSVAMVARYAIEAGIHAADQAPGP